MSVDTVASEPLVSSNTNVQRKEVYGDLVKGAKVTLDAGEYPRFKSMQFEFLCHARYRQTGKEWLELWGGRRGYEMVQAVNPSFVRRLIR